MTEDGSVDDGAVRDDPARQRYELATPSGPAVAAYEREGDRLILTHTVVPPAQEGRGVATRLIAGVFADAREKGLRIVPVCPFVTAYLTRHPEDRDLAVQEQTG